MSTTSPTDHPLSRQLLQHEGFVRRLAARLVGDAIAAEDVAQDAFALALQRGSAERNGLRAWLAGTVRRLAAHRGRGEARRRWREAAAARPEAMPVAEPLEEQQRVVEAVLALEEPFRETVLLTHYHGLTPSAIARRHAVPAATVRTRLHRAHQKLRDRLIATHGGDRRAWLAALVPVLSGERLGVPASTSSAVENAVGSVSTQPVPATAILGVLVVASGVGIWGLRETTGATAASIEPDPVTALIPVVASDDDPVILALRVGASLDPAQAKRRPALTPQEAELETRRLAYWEAVRSARAERKRFAEALPEKPADAALRRAVERAVIRPPIAFAGLSLRPVVELISDDVKVPIVVTPAALGIAREQDLRIDLEFREPHSLVAILDLLVFLTQEKVAWTVLDGELRLCTQEELGEHHVTFSHSIADFCLAPRDYFAPEDDIYPIFEGPIEIDELATMVVENVASPSWEQEGVFIEVADGKVTAHNGREVHEAIEVYLDQLRGFLLPLPEEGPPGEPVQLEAWAPNLRVADYLTRTTVESLFDVDAAGVHVVDLLAVAGEAGDFDAVRLGGADAVVVSSPAGPTSLAAGLDALRQQGVSWTLCHGIVVVWPGYSYSRLCSMALRDVRDLLTEAQIPAARLAGHPALEGWATESKRPFTLSADCIDQAIREFIDPESWDYDPAHSVRIGGGMLVLSQSPAVIAEVDGLLEALRSLLE